MIAAIISGIVGIGIGYGARAFIAKQLASAQKDTAAAITSAAATVVKKI